MIREGKTAREFGGSATVMWEDDKIDKLGSCNDDVEVSLSLHEYDWKRKDGSWFTETSVLLGYEGDTIYMGPAQAWSVGKILVELAEEAFDYHEKQTGVRFDRQSGKYVQPPKEPDCCDQIDLQRLGTGANEVACWGVYACKSCSQTWYCLAGFNEPWQKDLKLVGE